MTWGDSTYGGDSSGVANDLTDIIEIYASESVFVARVLAEKYS